jgi:hypothetical protein
MTVINCYTEIATVTALGLADAIKDYSHLIPQNLLLFGDSESGSGLVIKLSNKVICWDSAAEGVVKLLPAYSIDAAFGEPALPSFVPTTVTTTTTEKIKRTRRTNAQKAADEAAKAEALAKLAATEAVLDADVDADTEVETVEDIIYEVEADDDETTEEPEVTSEISTVSKRNLFANAA